MVKTSTLLQLFLLILFTGLSINVHAGMVCGDNTVDLEGSPASPEQCDTGISSTPLCNNAENLAGEEGNGPCRFTICGDGIVQVTNGDPTYTLSEQCDDGTDTNDVPFNSDTLEDACRTNCQFPSCGDSVVDTGEQCEPPGTATCDDNCQDIAAPFCGDGIVNGTDQCEPPGTATCDDNCQDIAAPFCGDGIVNGTDQCEPPGTATCDDNCQDIAAPFCGDGIVNGTDQCEPPGTATCDDNCQDIAAPFCGDGIVNGTDQCEPPGTATCDDNCQDIAAPFCGDGIVNGTDQCEPPGTATCDDNCQDIAAPFCGDGIVNGTDQCEPPGTATCDDNCQDIAAPFCGDGIVNGTDQCEPPGTATCDDNCQDIAAPFCGDGIVNGTDQCEPPGTATCDDNCQDIAAPFCGDGIVNGTDQCEPPGTATCDDNCQDIVAPFCGDGIVNGTDQCEPPGTATCDANCQNIVDTVIVGDLIIATEPGEALTDYHVEEATTGPSGISFPFGVISYTASVPNDGDTSTVTLTFPEDLPSNLILYKVDGGGVFTVLPTTFWTLIDDRTIEVRLKDGGDYDLDDAENGLVVDPIAPGGGRARSSDGGGCTLATTPSNDPTLPLLTLLSVSFLYRRRTRKAALRDATGR